MKWIDSNDLPLDKCKVSVELTREIEDDETGELVEEQLIIVRGNFLPGDDSVGLGPVIEVTSAHRSDTKEKEQVELEDWEVDSLVDLLQEQMRTESGRDF